MKNSVAGFEENPSVFRGFRMPGIDVDAKLRFME
jgi:hypothetical protein